MVSLPPAERPAANIGGLLGAGGGSADAAPTQWQVGTVELKGKDGQVYRSSPNSFGEGVWSTGCADGETAHDLRGLHSKWLAQALEDEAEAMCSDLERRHRECQAAVRAEFAHRHEALVSALGARFSQPLGAATGGRGVGPESSAIVSPTAAPRQVGFPGPNLVEFADKAMVAPGAVNECQELELSAGALALRGAGSADEPPAGAGTMHSPGGRERESERSSVLGTRQHSLGTGSEELRSENLHSKVMWRISSKLFAVSGSTTPMASWYDFVESTHFEVFIGIAIVLNGLQMAFEIQHQGLKLGSDIGYGFYKNPDPWPGATDLFHFMGFFFGVVFTIELTLKVAVLRSKFFCGWWNLFDMVVVLGWLVETLGEALQLKEESATADTTVFRIARLLRLLRLVRVVRQIRSFDALFLMTTAIQSSATVLFWACALLLMLQVLNALLLNQLLHIIYFGNDSYDNTAKQEVFEYFGTFSRSVLSTFEMTLANWPPVCRLLLENVSEWFMIFCILHKLTVGFAVIGIINGVFIQETFRVAANDDFIMMHEKEWQQKAHRRKMHRLFEAGDASGDGYLDRKEFLALLDHAEVRIWLASMDLDPSDGDALFSFMDRDNDHKVNAAELIEGVSKLKGPARSLDLLMLMHRQDELFRLGLDAAAPGGDRPALAKMLAKRQELRQGVQKNLPKATSRFKSRIFDSAGSDSRPSALT